MGRDDLFTNIHKALRRGLFEATVRAGATDWTDRDDVAALERQWRPLHGLLESHTRHEDDHILRILDPYEPATTAPVDAEHRALDAQLRQVAATFDTAAAALDPVSGLRFYRELALFVSAYLPHLDEEETVVMARVWDLCTDDEIAATRAAFMAEVTPEETALSMELMLPALDPRARVELLSTISAGAPRPVMDAVVSIAARVLDPDDFAALRDGAGLESAVV